jgi:hypothetical protein
VSQCGLTCSAEMRSVVHTSAPQVGACALPKVCRRLLVSALVIGVLSLVMGWDDVVGARGGMTPSWV